MEKIYEDAVLPALALLPQRMRGVNAVTVDIRKYRLYIHSQWLINKSRSKAIPSDRLERFFYA